MSRSDRLTTKPVLSKVSAPRRNFQWLGWAGSWAGITRGGWGGSGAGLVDWVGLLTYERKRGCYG